MKINLILLATVVGLLSFSSCAHDQLVEAEVRKEVKVSASIKSSSASSQVTTRVIGQQWESGDAIGLFMKSASSSLVQPSLATNVKFINGGTSIFTCKSIDKVYFPFNEANVDFISYYPYRKNLNGLLYEVDVTNQEDLAAIDLLYSDNVKNTNSTTDVIDLSLEYQLPKLSFEIVANNSGKDLANLTAKITNLNTKATFSLADGVMSKSFEPKDVSLKVIGNGTLAEAVVLPQDNLTETELILTIDATTYTYPIKKSPITTSFAKDTLYEFSITLEAGQGPLITGVTATIKKRTSKKEDIIITEDPAIPSGSKDEDVSGESSGGDGSIDGDDPDGSLEGDVDENPLKGDGSRDNPYSVTEVKELEIGVKKIWVKGYIVGGYETNLSLKKFTNDPIKISRSTLALSFTDTDLSPEMVFPVNLFHEKHNKKIENAINIKEHPRNLGKEIMLLGSIDYFKNTYEGLGLINIIEAVLDGVTY